MAKVEMSVEEVLKAEIYSLKIVISMMLKLANEQTDRTDELQKACIQVASSLPLGDFPPKKRADAKRLIGDMAARVVGLHRTIGKSRIQ